MPLVWCQVWLTPIFRMCLSPCADGDHDPGQAVEQPETADLRGTKDTTQLEEAPAVNDTRALSADALRPSPFPSTALFEVSNPASAFNHCVS